MIPILVNGNLPTIVSSSNLQSTPMNLKSVKDSTEQSSKKKHAHELCLDEKSEIKQLLLRIKELEDYVATL